MHFLSVLAAGLTLTPGSVYAATQLSFFEHNSCNAGTSFEQYTDYNVLTADTSCHQLPNGTVAFYVNQIDQGCSSEYQPRPPKTFTLYPTDIVLFYLCLSCHFNTRDKTTYLCTVSMSLWFPSRVVQCIPLNIPIDQQYPGIQRETTCLQFTNIQVMSWTSYQQCLTYYFRLYASLCSEWSRSSSYLFFSPF